MDTTFKESAFTPKLGEVRPIDISSHGRRDLHEKTVADLVETLRRDGRFLHPIAVRNGNTQHRLIAGHHRVEASKRCFGDQAPIPAIIFPSDTPDALIAILEIEENLLRKDLTAAERERQTILLAAALKQLDSEKLATEFPVSEPKAKSRASGGRGKKAMTARLADQLGLSKPAVQKRINQASAAIGEKIDLERDTPEELERKAEKRQRAEPTVVRLKRRNPALHVDDPTPAECHAGEIDSQIEAWLKAFDTFGETYQFRLAYLVCIRLGLDPFKMAPPAVFGLADEESELDVALPAEVAPATDAVAEQAEHGDDVAVAHAEADDEAAAAQASQGDNGAELGAEDLEDSGDDIPDAADPEIGVTKCAHCKKPLLSSDLPRKKYGRLYHRGDCVGHAKPIAIAA